MKAAPQKIQRINSGLRPQTGCKLNRHRLLHADKADWLFHLTPVNLQDDSVGDERHAFINQRIVEQKLRLCHPVEGFGWLLYSSGVIPKVDLKVLLKCSWEENPSSTAMSKILLSFESRASVAFAIRRDLIYSATSFFTRRLNSL